MARYKREFVLQEDKVYQCIDLTNVEKYVYKDRCKWENKIGMKTYLLAEGREELQID
jgi:hypothetical protein